jgi:hypothetical protein
MSDAYATMFATIQKRYQAMLQQKIKSLSQQCKNALVPVLGNSGMTSLAAKASGVVFWDSAVSPWSEFTASDVAGINAVAGNTYIRSVGAVNGVPPVATTLQVSQISGGQVTAVNTRNVVLDSAFFAEPLAQQADTLLHEALHYITNEIDAPLAKSLGISWGSKGPGNAITAFFDANCDKTKTY